jgi:phosphoglycerate kinase
MGAMSQEKKPEMTGSEKLFVEDLTVRGKRVLVRVDFNVPLEAEDGGYRITDDRRIQESLQTIRWLIRSGARTILMSHLGRPKGKPDKQYSLAPVAGRLEELLGKSVPLAPDCVGPAAKALAEKMKDGDVLLLENLRFHAEEEKNDPAFAAQLASLGEMYVNDAFGSAHRAHASTEGVTHHLRPCAAGHLMKKELDYLGKALASPRRPFVAIIGGAKISGKIDVIEHLLGKVDSLIIGGGMAFTFFKAMGYEVGQSILEPDKVELARDLLARAKTRAGFELLLPVDTVVADKFEGYTQTKTVRANAIPHNFQGMDIGPDSTLAFTKAIARSKTAVWNGPMGVFEDSNFAAGTIAVAKALADATQKGAVTIVGGGDSAAAIAQAGLDKKVSHVSTGGGASLEFLEGKVLPGVAALTDKGAAAKAAPKK